MLFYVLNVHFKKAKKKSVYVNVYVLRGASKFLFHSVAILWNHTGIYRPESVNVLKIIFKKKTLLRVLVGNY